MRSTVPALLLAIGLTLHAAEPHLARIDDHVYRGRQPKAGDFAELKKKGFKTVLDLRGGMIHKPHEKKLVEAAGMHYIGIRLSGIFPPKDRQIAQILSVLEDPARQPIFMHCRRGDDRVGLVVACYRMAHDHWTNQRAYEEACHFGMSRFEVLMRRYIRNFDPDRVKMEAARTGIAALHRVHPPPMQPEQNLHQPVRDQLMQRQ